MESFATGIRACLAEDYAALAFVFQKVGFLTTPLEFREAPGVPYRDVADAEGLAQFEDELRSAMAATEGGSSRFGALAEVLNGKLSKRWKMFTPPYCLLLIRTFLTLEGIAAQVDPDFNIYEMSLPWALRRSLAPTSPQGVATLRGSLLGDDNRVKWDAILDLVQDDGGGSSEAASDVQPEADLGEALTAVVGSSGGAALRKTMRDIDAADLATKLNPDGPVSLSAKGARRSALAAEPAPRAQRKWQRKVARFLVAYHLRTQLAGGLRGVATLAKLAWLGARRRRGPPPVALQVRGQARASRRVDAGHT
ncbi:hypothetical protein JL722_6480 [Aureococcus anophagefferens]|nr:hypothetical protein JL722_6480 [Aureococcus anophagefferens]